MTVAEIIQMITAIAAAVAGIGTVYNNMQLGQTHQKVAELEKNTNSIKDALVASTHKEGFQAGQIAQASQPEPSVIRPLDAG
jgi:alpha-D-ribose 1-methylphosphonate 5-triphosphate diphosphatase PhnM